MGRRDKSNKGRPNAPEFEQPLYQQPPHNPYYPNLNSQLSHPPPYSDSTAPSNSVPMAQINYPISHSGDYPRSQSSVIIHQVPQVPIPYDRRAARYQRKVKSFNSQTFVLAVIAAILSYVSYKLYDDRPCVFNFTVQKANNVELTIEDVREAHRIVAYGSAFIAFLCLLKCFTGESKSHSCYLFLIGICTLIGTLWTGYLAYLAFYTPCTLKFEELVSKGIKTATSYFADNIPSPDKQIFDEKTIFYNAKEDRNGLLIFLFDFANFVFYFSIFLGSTCMC